MHCVSIYPTENQDLNLHSITEMKKRFPDIEIGWSTHENPDDMLPMMVSYGLGARIFERHIGINTKQFKIMELLSKQIVSFLELKKK